jgi:hypothetical protein
MNTTDDKSFSSVVHVTYDVSQLSHPIDLMGKPSGDCWVSFNNMVQKF